MRCRNCGAELHANDGRYPNRGPWLDQVDWSVCDASYTLHAPREPVYTNALTELPEGYETLPECLLCLRPGTHRFAVMGGPDGWLCEKHKDDPVGGWAEKERR